MTDPLDNYQMLEELGSGSFGVVYKAIEKVTGQLVAIKHIDLDGTDDDIRDIQQEIALLSTCASSFVTQYKTSFVRGVKLWIVMEFLGGGSCLDLVKIAPFDEYHASIVLRELLLGLDYLHNSGKIHRDIKAANILLSHTGKVKIADFGVAAQLTNIKSQRMTFVGTPFWMAPEVIQEEGYDARADIWSLGITAIELIKGEPPNADLHPMKALFHIPKEPPPRLEGPRYSRDLRSFIARCLIKDPDQRPSAKDLLQHRFIQRAGPTRALKDLIERRHARQKRNSGDKAQPKFYEQTLKDMSGQNDDGDDWVFDTVKPAVAAQPRALPRPPAPAPGIAVLDAAMPDVDMPQAAALPIPDNSISAQPITPGNQSSKKRKLSLPVDELSRLSILDAPNTPQPESEDLFMTPPTHTVRRVEPRSPQPPMKQHDQQSQPSSVSRRHSTAIMTSRRVSSPRKPLATSVVQAQIENSPRMSPGRPSQHQDYPRQKQPLAVDTSFGNGASNARPFRRTSHELAPGSNDNLSAKPISHEPITNENTPPPHPATTKEARLGRRAFQKAIEPGLSSLLAQSVNQEPLSKLGQAWSALDALDPEGEFLLLKSILEKVQRDPKLSNALGVAQCIVPGTPVSAQTPSTPSRRTSQLPPSTPTPRRDRESGIALAQNRQPPQSNLPQRSPSKLVLAQNNPHLKSHRRRQSSQVSFVTAVAERNVSNASNATNMGPPPAQDLESKVPHPSRPTHARSQSTEQTRQLADALYGRWIDGMKSRWPQT